MYLSKYIDSIYFFCFENMKSNNKFTELKIKMNGQIRKVHATNCNITATKNSKIN